MLEMLDQTTVNNIFQALAAHNPNPECELDAINPFTFSVAVILSAQTTDVQVNKATIPLFKIVHTPEDMVKLGEEKLAGYIKTIGLYKTKAKRVIEFSQILIEKHGSKVPANFEDLCELPGVGRKTANVILNTLFDHPVIAVDTHVFRVSRRIGLTDQKTLPKVEVALEKIIPAEWKVNAGHWLVLLGRYICKARKPLCDQCPINKWCRFYQSLQADRQPSTHSTGNTQ